MKLIYLYDALCGWCFGFSPVMDEFYKRHHEEMDFEVISGGMVTGSRITTIGAIAEYLGDAFKTVEQHTGVQFGEPFKENIAEGSAVFSSVPPSIALSICKEEKPEQQVPFAGALHKAIYVDGLKPMELDAYGVMAMQLGWEQEDFVAKMKEKRFADAAQADFATTQQFGVSGFPTVVLESAGEYYLLSRGYSDLETLETNFSGAKTMSLAKQNEA